MYDRQTRVRAVELYLEHHSAAKVAKILDGPSRSCIGSWMASAFGSTKRVARTEGFTVDAKIKAVKRVLAGEAATWVAKDIDVSSGAVYCWVRRYEKSGSLGLMSRQDEQDHAAQPRGDDRDDIEIAQPDELEELKERCADLELELSLMKGVVEIVKKDPGVDLETLSNKEKTALIDALRPMYSLTCLISKLKIAASSYHYNHTVVAAPDKYAGIRQAIIDEFVQAGRTRGYRYLHMRVRKRTDVGSVGEKKVRAIMSEEGLVVIYDKKRRRRYDSYKGEISKAPENLVNRNFHAGAPNVLWLTDITEFKLPKSNQKIYLSPIVDCFDGALVSWSVGLSPDAALANSSLLKACKKLAADERPVCHSDRGSHYRWPGWISICEGSKVVRSMSKKGCSPDNSACEGFFGRLKNEFFYYRDWEGVSAEEFMESLEAWLCYYNDDRVKQSLGWKSPMQYRKSLGIAV